MLRLALLSGLVVSSFLVAEAPKDTVENYPDGKPKAKFRATADGKKDGPYSEFWESGKPKVKATYKADELTGAYNSFYESGKPRITASYKVGELDGKYVERDDKGDVRVAASYTNGALNGQYDEFDGKKWLKSQIWVKGELVYTKTPDFIKQTILHEIGDVRTAGTKATRVQIGAQRQQPAAAPTAAPGSAVDSPEQIAALKRLQAYRFLCDVPYDEMSVDAKYIEQAMAAAKVCAKLGRLDHNPPNPGGMPEDEYELGKKGAGHSNLAMSSGGISAAGSVDMWMDDSDKSNIDRVGHRRWCINPAMAKTGFGVSGGYSAMYSMDGSRKDVPDYDYTCFPACGFMPVEYFKGDYAFSVTPNPSKYAKPNKDEVKASIYPVDARGTKAAEPLSNNYYTVENSGFGVSQCIIFRADKLLVTPGAKYIVEITGLKPRKEGAPDKITYTVEFFSMQR